MSYPINQKINPTMQPSMGLNQINTPQLQNVDAEKIHQGITQNSALKGVAGGSDDKPWLTPALTIPVWIAMALGMDKFNAKCRGKYEDSLVGKVEAWAEKTGNNSFFQSKPMKWVENTLTATNRKFMDKIVPKSKILTAIIHTPSEPTNNMVLMMKDSTFGEVKSDAITKLGEYTKDGKINLDKLGITAEEFEEIKKNPRKPENIKKLMQVCENSGDQFVEMKNIGKIPLSKKFSANKQAKYLSDFIPGLKKVLGRKVYFTEYSNKLKALDNGSKTWVGKKVPKFMLRLIEGLTNGTAGGKFAILMGAFFVADAIKKTIDAPNKNGEKRKTFAENFIYNEAMYLTMPLGLKLMHGAGGLQYIGVSKEKLDKFRTEKKAFDEKVLAGQYKDKAAYKAEVKRIKEIKAPDINILKSDKAGTKLAKGLKNIIYKPLTWAAKVLTTHLETFESFNPKGITKESTMMERFTQFITHGKARGVKWAVGGPTRFIVYLMLIAPFLGKIAAKGSHVVFGKPAKSVLDDDEPKEEKGQKQQPLPQAYPVAGTQVRPQVVSQTMRPAQQMQPSQNNMAYNQSAMTQRNNTMNVVMPNTTAQKPMNLPEAGRTYSYMPSAEGIKIKNGSDASYNPNSPQVQSLMGKADNAEKSANRYIK